MKRDMDLVRQILMIVEEKPAGSAPQKISIPGYDDATVIAHVQLLHEARLIWAADCTTTPACPEWQPGRLTWEGHEFLESTRNDTVWNRAKTELGRQGLGFSFELLKTAVVAIAKQKIAELFA